MLTYKTICEQTVREQFNQAVTRAKSHLDEPIAKTLSRWFGSARKGLSKFGDWLEKEYGKARQAGTVFRHEFEKSAEKANKALSEPVASTVKRGARAVAQKLSPDKGYAMSPEEASKRLAGELTKAAGLTAPPAAAIANPELLTIPEKKKPAVKIPKQQKTEVEHKPAANIPKKTTKPEEQPNTKTTTQTKPEEHTTTPKQSTTGGEQHTTTTTQPSTGGGTDHNVPSGDHGEHQEHTQGLLHKAWSAVSKAAQEHPAAAGALGALAAGAAGLGLKKLISRRRKKQQV